jgi:hypothetical protein
MTTRTLRHVHVASLSGKPYPVGVTVQAKVLNGALRYVVLNSGVVVSDHVSRPAADRSASKVEVSPSGRNGQG